MRNELEKELAGLRGRLDELRRYL